MNKLFVPVALIALGLIALLAVGISQGSVPELDVREIGEETASLHGSRTLKVHGLLASIESAERPLRFTLKDKTDPSRTIVVTHRKGRPDTFQVDYDVAVLGTWDPQSRTFDADQIFTKCPSKYEALEKDGIGSARTYEDKRGLTPPAESDPAASPTR